MINLTEREPFYASDFVSDGLILHVPRKLSDFSFANGRLSLKIATIVCKKEPIVISALMQGRAFQFTGEWLETGMYLDFVSDDIIRIRQNGGDALLEKPQPMLIEEPAAHCEPEITDTESELTASTKALRVVITKNPFCLEIFDSDGKSLIRQYNDDMHSVVNDRRRGFKEGGGDTMSDEQEALSFPGMECFPSCFVKNAETGKSAWNLSADIRFDESFYGFGEQFSAIDKNGQDILIWTVNPVGVSSTKAYKPVPFFMSSKGYGVYCNSPRKTVFKMGGHYFKAWSCEVQDELLDLFVIGGSFSEILHRYTSLTGRSVMPPKWAFGVWMSRNCYKSSEEMLSVAKELREQKLPCDVLHLDWAYCKGSFDFAFDEARFPNPKLLTDTLRDMGLHLSIWNLPYQKTDSPIYADGAAKNALVLDGEAQEAVVDFSCEEGRAWYREKITALYQAGVQVLKTDFGENAQPELSYRGLSGEDMHNLYPLLYNQTAYEAGREVWGEDFLLWGRSAFAGCQRYPVYWGGDSDSDYSGMYHSLRGGLSIGMSGFPFWSHDVGGYFCTPEPDVYIRWLQFGMFSPMVRFHGTSAREPWAFGEEAVRQYRKYAGLRYRLMEYIYCEAMRCVADSTPLMRAMALDFPADKTVRNMDDQYLFGRNILVAPVFSRDKSRMVYLPADSYWMDLHQYKWYSGGKWIEVETPIDIMPLFLRGGTITPFFEEMQCVDEKPHRLLRLEILPIADIAQYHLVTDKLNINAYYHFYNSERGELTISGVEGLDVDVHICCPDVKSLLVNGKEVAFTYESNKFVSYRFSEA